jgi:hypothetical protein
MQPVQSFVDIYGMGNYVTSKSMLKSLTYVPDANMVGIANAVHVDEVICGRDNEPWDFTNPPTPRDLEDPTYARGLLPVFEAVNVNWNGFLALDNRQRLALQQMDFRGAPARGLRIPQSFWSSCNFVRNSLYRNLWDAATVDLTNREQDYEDFGSKLKGTTADTSFEVLGRFVKKIRGATMCLAPVAFRAAFTIREKSADTDKRIPPDTYSMLGDDFWYQSGLRRILASRRIETPVPVRQPEYF